MQTVLFGILEEGFVYAILSLGVYITYKILDFPDLSVDGTYPLGAAVTAALIVSGVNPYIALVISFFAGIAAGFLTGVIHVKLGVRDLLSGIIVSLGLFSVNLKIAGKANLAFFSEETIFTSVASIGTFGTVILLIALVIVCKLLLDFYLNTKSGYLLRATGSNDKLVTALGKDKGSVRILGLALANGFAAFAGAIMCQKQGYFDVGMGTGTMVIGLANVIIGTQLLKKMSFIKATTAVIIGSVIYRACVAFAINLGAPAEDLKLITAILFLVILVISDSKSIFRKKLSNKSGKVMKNA
ncbi:MAG: ABC transporter permease [Eubacteriales bacterium]|nr:ABC transporter permease [Eubacteriales bacterium]